MKHFATFKPEKNPQTSYFQEKANAVQVHRRKGTNKEFQLFKIHFPE